VPKPLDEIRDPRDKFSSVKSVSAAAGIKIVAPDLEGALAGAPLYTVPEGDEPDKYAKLVTEEIGKIRIATDTNGIILKTDTLGSLEAIAEILKRNNIPVRLADVGDISKRDIVEAAVVKEKDPTYGAVLAFGVKTLPDAEEEAEIKGIRIFRDKIIYQAIEEYLAWFKSQREKTAEQEFETLVSPGKMQVLQGFVFRRAKPAIFGVEILAGKIAPRISLLRAKDGEDIGEIQQIQDKGKALPQASKGMEVAVSMDKPIVGRHVFERDVLFVKVPEPHAKLLLATFLDRLSEDEKESLNEYVEMMRKRMPFWAA